MEEHFSIDNDIATERSLGRKWPETPQEQTDLRTQSTTALHQCSRHSNNIHLKIRQKAFFHNVWNLLWITKSLLILCYLYLCSGSVGYFMLCSVRTFLGQLSFNWYFLNQHYFKDNNILQWLQNYVFKNLFVYY